MESSVVLNVTSQCMSLVLWLSMPPILVATFVGLIVSLIQALTQIQEQTLGFAIKLICVTVILALTTYWMGDKILAYTEYLFNDFPLIVR